MYPSREDHTSKMHVNRLVQQDLERIINDECNAAASFDSERTRHILTEETLSRQWPNIEKWLVSSGNMDKKAFWHYFDKSDQKDIDAPIEHLGAFKHAKTKRIYLRTTRIVCIVIIHDDQAENGYRIFNCYPYVSPTRCGETLDVNPLQYIMATNSWKYSQDVRRTYLRICCDHTTTFPVSYDTASASIETPIKEGDCHFGTVRCNRSIMTMLLDDATNDYRAYPNDKNTMLRRAFPTTMENVDKIYSVMSMGSLDDALIAESKIDLTDVFDLRTLIVQMPEQKPVPTPKEPKDDSEKRRRNVKARGRERALAKSRLAQPKKKRKSTKKKPQKPKPETTVQEKLPQTPVPTDEEKTEPRPAAEPTSAHVPRSLIDNVKYIQTLYANNVPLANDYGEVLLPYGQLIGFDLFREPVILLCSGAETDAVKQAIYEKNTELLTSDTTEPFDFDIDYSSILHAVIEDKAVYRVPSNKWKSVQNEIANNASWQPCVPDAIRKELDESVMTRSGTHIHRTTKIPKTDALIIDRYELEPMAATQQIDTAATDDVAFMSLRQFISPQRLLR